MTPENKKSQAAKWQMVEAEYAQALAEERAFAKDHSRVKKKTRLPDFFEFGWKVLASMIIASVVFWMAIGAVLHGVLTNMETQERFETIERENHRQIKLKQQLAESEHKEQDAKNWLYEKKRIVVQ